MKRVVPNLLLAGVMLGLLEVGWVVPHAGALFLSFGERFVYALAATSALAATVLALGLGLELATRGVARAGRALAALAALATSAPLFWALSEGRRVREAALRPWAVALAALLVGLATYVLLGRVARARTELTRGVRSALCVLAALVALGVLVVDVSVLPRGYPPFHLGLLLFALSLASVAGLLAPEPLLRDRYRFGAAALVLAAAPWLLARVAAHPTAGFAVREHAPWTAKLMRPFAAAPRSAASSAAPRVVTRAQGGVDLRDRDVLLITVDALRADLLRAYGGKGVTPELDRIAEESAVFTRAYTPAPHTSYALASLLTGKFVKPLVELGGKLGDPPTLPDRLRRYGYRTAAFYPPAVFFVDGASFEALARRAFGFEYQKEMFASADARVAQLDEYLAQAPARPLFVWVHLFEPHEPYDPPSDIAHDGSERGRYEAEVRACDRAIAELVRHFRAARPRATVIITADHGEEFGDHGGRFHGSTLYDEQVRVPLVWSSPGVVAPRRIDAPVELTDLGTTILSTAAIPRDAHMRGDDLSALLAGESEAPRYAFASIDARHMITDGHKKAICGTREAHCALFDLARDPHETANLAARELETVTTLRAALDGFLASISKAEGLTVSEGVRLPSALARAKLGGASSGEELLPLLADESPAVRAETARVFGERGLEVACAELTRLRAADPDQAVRAEATIAALRLGDRAALPDAVALVTGTPPPAGERAARDRVRLAALAIARAHRVEALPVLAELALDESASEAERLAALAALGELGDPRAFEALSSALAFVRLRAAAARALAELGDARAIPILRKSLSQERYPPTRLAEAEALKELGDARLAELVRHALGMESSLPEGMRLLREAGALAPAQGGALVRASAREGSWHCDERACEPGRDAVLALPKLSSRAPRRVVLEYEAATPESALHVDGQRHALRTASGQLSFERSASSPPRVALSAEGRVALVSVLVVPSVAELPPPAPEPWDAGTSAALPSALPSR